MIEESVCEVDCLSQQTGSQPVSMDEAAIRRFEANHWIEL